MGDHSQIVKIASRVRLALEGMDKGSLPINMQEFPRGACGDATLILGSYLEDVGISGFSYVTGERGDYPGSWHSHAWLQRGTLVVDITADQFDDAPQGIVVADPSPWHSTFDDVRQSAAHLRHWSGTTIPQVEAVYRQLLVQLPLEESRGNVG
jgi:hypothetical protein